MKSIWTVLVEWPKITRNRIVWTSPSLLRACWPSCQHHRWIWREVLAAESSKHVDGLFWLALHPYNCKYYHVNYTWQSFKVWTCDIYIICHLWCGVFSCMYISAAYVPNGSWFTWSAGNVLVFAELAAWAAWAFIACVVETGCPSKLPSLGDCVKIRTWYDSKIEHLWLITGWNASKIHDSIPIRVTFHQRARSILAQWISFHKS